MNSSRRLALSLLVILLGLSLAACGSFSRREKRSAASVQAAEPANAPQTRTGVFTEQSQQPASQAAQSSQARSAPTAPGSTAWPDGQAQEDSQGAVWVTVTPLNLNNPGDALVFDVALNTHSVDLSMDLATLSTLTTDTGLSVQAITWDAPRGGHHVQGRLYFPVSVNGTPLLDGARKVTLVVTNVDAPERVFVWER